MIMYRIQFVLAAVMCLLVSYFTSSVNGQSAQLKWKLKPEQKFEIVIKQDVSIEMADSGDEMKIGSVGYMDWNVTDVDSDGIVTVESKFSRVEMESDYLGDITSVDTEKELADGAAGSEVLEQFSQVIDKSFSLKFDSAGKLKKFEMPEDLDPSVVSTFKPMVIDMMTKSTHYSLIEFPEGAISVGDEWTKEITTDTDAGKMDFLNSYTYKGEVKRDNKTLHHIQVKIVMEVQEDHLTIESQEITGNVYFDGDAGHIHFADVDQVVELTIRAGGQQIRQKIKQKATGKCSKKKN